MAEIFKKDSKDKIRILKIYTDGDQLIQESGIYGGNLVKNQKTCNPKNVGKSNETTGAEQAISEMESKITEKLKEDYFRTVDEAENIKVILPMLAHSYKDHQHKITWGITFTAVQPKLDGMRALGVTGPNASLTSREGSPITTMEHIINDLKRLPAGQILDGELYAHGESFQENMRLIKKYRPGTSESVKYHVYDIIGDTPFVSRFILAHKSFSYTTEHIQVVPTNTISSVKDLLNNHAKNIAEGYEGTILRWGGAPYKINGRSENLLKYKEFYDLALPIKDIRPSDARPDEGVAVYEWLGAKDNELGSGMKLSKVERREWLANKEKYIGKTAEVRFFEYSENGVPRFPVTVGIRLDK